jgi:hypothetical protein
MKTRRIIPLLLALALIPAIAFSAEYGRARIGFLSGDVQIQTADTPEWLPASTNTPLREGDRVWVPQGGRTEIQVLGGAFIRLDALTSLDALSLGTDYIQFYLNGGHAYINNRREGIDSIQIDTPLSSILCKDDSLVMIDVAERGATEISVLKGDAYAETRNGKIRVPAGNALLIREDLRAEFYPLAADGKWEEWNRQRDRILAGGGESLRYLPNELDDYVSDFENNGRWINTTDYGYAWIPSVSISLNWAPYRNGRWIWMGGNYIWISYEPWGWAPYHYGRWVFLGGRGWCWVPPHHGAAHWGPGYVGWVHTPTYVSWVPLAPGDTYYGYGDYGPGSVNINTININMINVQQHFRNIDARNAVTSLHRDTFFHGRRSDFRLHENPFKERNVGFGPPPLVKPDRTTVSPVIRKIPVAKLPPPRVQQIQPEKIRRERRLVTDERGSVFRPGSSVPQMRTIRREEPTQPVRERIVQPPSATGQAGTTKEKPSLGTPVPPPQPSTIKPSDGRAERHRLPLPPGATETPSVAPAEKPPAIVKPPKERKPRTTVSPTSTTPAAVPPATPSSTTGTRPSGQSVERTRIRTAPSGISSGRQQGAVTGTPTQDRSRTTGSQGIRVAPQQVAPQPVAPTPVWRPQKIQKQQVPASTGQPLVKTPPPRVQRPATVSPTGPQQPAQPVKIQRYQTPAPPTYHQGQPPNQMQRPGQQPTVKQHTEQKPPARQESGTKEKTSSKPGATQQQTGTGVTPPSYPYHGQGGTGVR